MVKEILFKLPVDFKKALLVLMCETYGWYTTKTVCSKYGVMPSS